MSLIPKEKQDFNKLIKTLKKISNTTSITVRVVDLITKLVKDWQT